MSPKQASSCLASAGCEQCIGRAAGGLADMLGTGGAEGPRAVCSGRVLRHGRAEAAEAARPRRRDPCRPR